MIAAKPVRLLPIRFRNSQAREEGEELINKSGILSSVGYQATSAAKMLPKISLTGVNNCIFDDVNKTLNKDDTRTAQKAEILRLLCDKNPCLQELVGEGHTCEVVYVNTSGTGSHNVQIGLKVSPAIRCALLCQQSGFVFLPGNRYLFKDRFHFKQCYHCQLIGHVSTDCPVIRNDSTCMYCMGNHQSKSCTDKKRFSKHACAKCHASQFPIEAENYKSHNSASPDCPVVLRECKRLANVTDFTSKNVM